MSRIGKSPIAIPSGVEVTIAQGNVTVKGSKGTLSRPIPGDIIVRKEESTIFVERPNDERENRALHGLTRTLVANMVEGVTAGSFVMSASGSSAKLAKPERSKETALWETLDNSAANHACVVTVAYAKRSTELPSVLAWLFIAATKILRCNSSTTILVVPLLRHQQQNHQFEAQKLAPMSVQQLALAK